MEQGIISKKDVMRLFESIAGDCTLYIPVSGRNGIVLTEFTGEEELTFDYHNFQLSQKDMFVPQPGSYDSDDCYILRDVPSPDDTRVIFGMRPCDAHALTLIDKAYEDCSLQDQDYQKKRRNTVILTLACTEPLRTCFCFVIDGSPAGTEGADILVFDIGDSLLFEVCSGKGKELFDTFSSFFKEPGKSDRIARNEQVKKSMEQLSAHDGAVDKENRAERNDISIGETISENCIGCGICMYLCPASRCFTLFDDAAGSNGHIEIWDSIIDISTTSELPENNPGVSITERMRQRVIRKFAFFEKDFGETVCAGCGRCILNCPGSLDIREVFSRLSTEKDEK